MVPDLLLENGMHDTYLPPTLGGLLEDDTVINISPQMALEFAIPYYNRISDAMGGCVIHSCGDWSHHFEMFKENVHNLRGIWFNAGECSFERAAEVFRGTDVVLIPRWPLSTKYFFRSRVDFVRQILAAKPPDVSVLLQAHHFGDQSRYDPGVADELDQNAVSEQIMLVIERFLRVGAVD
jgi:hypothetical protein